MTEHGVRSDELEGERWSKVSVTHDYYNFNKGQYPWNLLRQSDYVRLTHFPLVYRLRSTIVPGDGT